MVSTVGLLLLGGVLLFTKRNTPSPHGVSATQNVPASQGVAVDRIERSSPPAQRSTLHRDAGSSQLLQQDVGRVRIEPSEYDRRMAELENRLAADPAISERQRLRQVWELHVELRLGESLTDERRRRVIVIHEDMLDARDRLDAESAGGPAANPHYAEQLAEIVRAANRRYAAVLSRNEYQILMDAEPEDDPLPLLRPPDDTGPSVSPL